MAALCLSNCICRFTNSRGSSSKKAQTSSASPINIPRYSKKSVCVKHLLCPPTPSLFRADDLALVLVQTFGNGPKEVSLTQLLQCSSLRHANVPDIICLFTDILAQQVRKRKWGSLFFLNIYRDTTLNVILNIFMAHRSQYVQNHMLVPCGFLWLFLITKCYLSNLLHQNSLPQGIYWRMVLLQNGYLPRFLKKIKPLIIFVKSKDWLHSLCE